MCVLSPGVNLTVWDFLEKNQNKLQGADHFVSCGQGGHFRWLRLLVGNCFTYLGQGPGSRTENFEVELLASCLHRREDAYGLSRR